MICQHIVSYAKLLERETNAHSYMLCKHAQPSSMDTRTPEMIVLNLFLHSATSKCIDVKGNTVVRKFNRNPKSTGMENR